MGFGANVALRDSKAISLKGLMILASLGSIVKREKYRLFSLSEGSSFEQNNKKND